MQEMEIDLDKMPLGALSKSQIEKGFLALSDVSAVLTDDTDMDEKMKKQVLVSTCCATSAAATIRTLEEKTVITVSLTVTTHTHTQKFLSASNKFYTIIPCDFGKGGMTEIHMIDSEKKLKAKLELVETLLEMEIALNLGKGKG